MRSSSSSSSVAAQPDSDFGSISEDNRSLAAKLSGHMGIEHAIQVSTENQWHGVVAALREIQQKKSPRG